VERSDGLACDIWVSGPEELHRRDRRVLRLTDVKSTIDLNIISLLTTLTVLLIADCPFVPLGTTCVSLRPNLITRVSVLARTNSAQSIPHNKSGITNGQWSKLRSSNNELAADPPWTIIRSAHKIGVISSSTNRNAMNMKFTKYIPESVSDFLGLLLSGVLQNVKELTSTLSSISTGGIHELHSRFSMEKGRFGRIGEKSQSTDNRFAVSSSDWLSVMNTETTTQSSDHPK
jgi:hypothetical protein